MTIFNLGQLISMALLGSAFCSALLFPEIPRTTLVVIGWLAAMVPLSAGAIIRIEQLLKPQ